MVNFWGQEVKDQGHMRPKYVTNRKPTRANRVENKFSNVNL